MEGEFYLMEMGGRSGGDQPAEVFVQPMVGTPEKLENHGETFSIRRDLFEVMRAATVHIPEQGSLPRVIVESGQTCPRRVNNVGPWAKESGLDTWEKQGADRKCSFCGSIHPDDMWVLLREPEVGFSISDQRHKVYIQRAHVLNAGFGAIKWYVWHGNQALIDAISSRLKIGGGPRHPRFGCDGRIIVE